MNYKRYVLSLIAFATLNISNLLSMESAQEVENPVGTMFESITKNDPKGFEQALKAGATISSVDLNGKTVLFAALQNFYKQTQRSFGLRLAAAITAWLGTAVGMVLPLVRSIDIIDDSIKGKDIKFDKDFDPVMLGSFLAAAGSTIAAISFSRSAHKTRMNINKAKLILDRVFSEYLENKIKPDLKSLEFMNKLTPQLKAATKKLEAKIE